MRTHLHTNSILATGWLVIIVSILITFTFNPARLAITLPSLNTETVATPSIKSSIMTDKSQLTCMARNIYYEAGQESLIGKLAVGQVVLNRLAHAANSTICGIINEKSRDTAVCAFSWTCQKNLPSIDMNSKAWRESNDATITLLQLNTQTRDLTNGATHYHNTSVHPQWANSLKRLLRVDNHIFYR